MTPNIQTEPTWIIATFKMPLKTLQQKSNFEKNDVELIAPSFIQSSVIIDIGGS